MEHQVQSGKRVLRLNLDETAVRFFYKGQRGLTIMRGGKRKRTANEFVQKAGMAEQKKSVTHVCIICDDTTLQPKLPQLVLANEHTLRVQDIAELDNVPPNVHIKRRKSAWINVPGLVEYIRLLGDALRAHAPDRQPILIWDALRVHLHEKVLRAAGREGILVVAIPAKMTWLLQPLDTDVFARYKQSIRRRYRDTLVRGHGDTIHTVTVLQVIGQVCREVLQGNAWSQVFQKNGFESGQPHVRRSLLTALEWDRVPMIPNNLPTLSQLQYCWPAGSNIPIEALFSGVIARPRQAIVGPEPDGEPFAPSHVPPLPPPVYDVVNGANEPWSARLRKRPSVAVPVFEQPQPSAGAEVTRHTGASSSTAPWHPSMSSPPRPPRSAALFRLPSRTALLQPLPPAPPKK